MATPSIPAAAGILAANTAVFLSWKYAEMRRDYDRDPRLYRFLRQNFVLSRRNAQERIWTPLTCSFSHMSLMHFGVNMFGLWSMAPAVTSLVGRKHFYRVYFASALGASAASLLNGIRIGQHADVGSVGASGSILGTLALLTCIQPRAKFLLFFVVPLPAWACLGLLMAYDTNNVVSQKETLFNSAGHMGGVATGILYYLALTRGKMLR